MNYIANYYKENAMDLLDEVSTVSLPLPRCTALTKREHDVLMCVAWGMSNKEVGSTLGISHRTVEIHRIKLLRKLQARNAPDAVRIAISLGLNLDRAPHKAEMAA